MPARAFRISPSDPSSALTVGSIGTGRGAVNGPSGAIPRARRHGRADGAELTCQRRAAGRRRTVAGDGAQEARVDGGGPGGAALTREPEGRRRGAEAALLLEGPDVVEICQRSVSGSAAQGGIAPRPVLIFQNRHPSVSCCTFADVQSAGFGLSAAAPGPSPLPESPWHAVHALSTVCFLPAATAASLFATGFFLAFSAAGQVQAA